MRWQQQRPEYRDHGRQLQNLLIPIPPLAEQYRIVSKIEELIRLIDQLEYHLAARQTVHDAFSTAAFIAWKGDPKSLLGQPAGIDAMTTSYRYVPADAAVIEDTVVGAGLPWSGPDRPGRTPGVRRSGGTAGHRLPLLQRPRSARTLPRPEARQAPGQHLPRAGLGAVVGTRPQDDDHRRGHLRRTRHPLRLLLVRARRRALRPAQPRACQQNFELELARHGLDAAAVVPNVTSSCGSGESRRECRDR